MTDAPAPGSAYADVKPAAASTTVQAAVLAGVGAIAAGAPLVSKLVHGDQLNVEQITALGGAVLALIGAIGAVYGRLKATSKVVGFLTVPARFQKLNRL